MCNNILNILKFIIKFNKYIIIVIDLEHFQNFPHCGVHLKRWKKKVHQVRKKKWTHVSIKMNKWKYNRVNLYTNNPLSFPPAKIYSLQWTSIINQSLDNSPTAWLLYGRVLFWSFILPLGNIFFFNRKWKIFAVQDFWNFWWKLIFAIFFSSSRTSTRNKTWHV